MAQQKTIKQIVEFEQVIQRGCGLDVHEKTIIATIDGEWIERQTRTFDTFTSSSKVESGERYLSIEAANKITKHFSMTMDELVNFNGSMPTEVTIEDKLFLEQVKLIAELEPDEKNMVFKMIDAFLTKKK